MQQIIRGTGVSAIRRIPLYLVDDTDGKTPKTGLVFVAGEVKVSVNGAAEGNGGGAVTEIAGGLYYYTPTTAESSTAGFLTVRIIKATVRPFVAAAQVADQPADFTTAERTSITTAAARIDVVLSTRLAAAGYVAPDNATVATILGRVDVPTSTRLEATAYTPPDNVSVGTILARTDVAISSRLAAADYVAADAAPTAVQVADAILIRSIKGGADGGRTVGQALATLRNRMVLDYNTSTLTVYDIDDVTPLWTGSVTTAEGNPINSIDPA